MFSAVLLTVGWGTLVLGSNRSLHIWQSSAVPTRCVSVCTRSKWLPHIQVVAGYAASLGLPDMHLLHNSLPPCLPPYFRSTFPPSIPPSLPSLPPSLPPTVRPSVRPSVRPRRCVRMRKQPAVLHCVAMVKGLVRTAASV